MEDDGPTGVSDAARSAAKEWKTLCKLASGQISRWRGISRLIKRPETPGGCLLLSNVTIVHDKSIKIKI